MKSYLGLIPISAKVHKKQHRMTLLSISLAVFLVTAIFGMADMEIQSQKLRIIQDSGNWHLMLKNITDEEAALIASRPGITASSWYGVLNYGLDEDYFLGDQEILICGVDRDGGFYDSIMTSIQISKGTVPQNDTQILLTENAADQLGIFVGDQAVLNGPDGAAGIYTVSGFIKPPSMIMKKDVLGGFLTTEAYRAMYPYAPGAAPENPADSGSVFYLRFSESINIKHAIEEIQTQYGFSKEQVSINNPLLGLMGQSGDSYLLTLYFIAFILFLLVLTAAVFMITGSLNSNISQRTEFFGMLRCLGASGKQISRYVRLEALFWCRSAVVLGLIPGIIIVWILCAVLRNVSPLYFSTLPVLGFSWIGILFGVLSGILTVLFAARTPAKKAAAVSPLTAVSGNASGARSFKKVAGTKLFGIENALGVHHATADKKSFLLMAGSFAFSIILFLAFLPSLSFMKHAIRPLKPYTPDLSIASKDNTGSIDRILSERLITIPGVKRVYGRMSTAPVTAVSNGSSYTVNFISYEEHQFAWAKNSLLEGSMDGAVQDGGVLIVYNPLNPLHAGDRLMMEINGQTMEVTVSGILSDSPFKTAKETDLICISTEETLSRLTGESQYVVVDLQLTASADDNTVAKLRDLAGPELEFSDRRASNTEVRGTYLSFALFLYGFLAIIAMISVFNIMNSIAMSVWAMTGQYGAMRAIGMSGRQLVMIILSEALTYAVGGSFLGSALGLPLNKIIFEQMITGRWGEAWAVPWGAVFLILALVFLSSAGAVWGPAGRIRKMSVVETIRAQ